MRALVLPIRARPRMVTALLTGSWLLIPMNFTLTYASLSFVFNTAILAFSINVAASMF